MKNEEPIIDCKNNHCQTQKTPTIIYQAAVLPITNEITTETDKFITRVIWNNSKPKVK